MPIPTVNLDFCSEPSDLYCPVCGQMTFTLGVQQESCHHLIFWGNSVDGSWAWLQEQYHHEFNLALQKEYLDVKCNGFYGSFDDFRETLQTDKVAAIAAGSISKKSVFMLAVSTSDIGCGGMYNGTIHAIFDYQSQGHKRLNTLPLPNTTHATNKS